MTVIAAGFAATQPLSCAQGRYGELIIAQGAGVQPKRWTGSGSATNAGIAAPAAAPTVTVQTPARYYVARIDVHKPGAVYNAPPSVTVANPTSPPTGFRAAKAQAYLSQAVVNEIVVTDGGKFYPDPPAVTLSASHGTGAVLTPVMDGTLPASDTITQYEIIQGPPFDDETDYPPGNRTQWQAWGSVDIPVVNGTASVSRTVLVYHNACGLGPGDVASYGSLTLNLSYTVSGATGTGAIARVNFYGQRVIATACPPSPAPAVWLVAGSYLCRSVTAKAVGTGYSPTGKVTITIAAHTTLDTTTGAMTTTVPSTKSLIIEGYPPGHAQNTATPRTSIQSITVTNGGSGYVVAPDIAIASPSGFGAYATSAVAAGAITSVTLESGGGGYKTLPTVTAVAGKAEAFAVARAHLRGKYQCYYRYVDNTAAALGGPIPSNLSPVREIDAGAGAQSITWTAAAAGNTDGRSLTIELWRTTSDQALMLYRVGTGTSLVDSLTDEEVRDPDRAGYAAMPIVLPNGDLNANRFTPPPNNKAVVVRFQDRMWYAVDTGGSEPNSIYFSEVDEPESVPDINEFVLQQNARDSDAVTALVPFGASMLIMQSRHAFTMSFSKQPIRDANVSPLANRGCLGQRCWDIHAGVCYVMDRYGVYAVSPQGEFKDISAPIGDLFRSRLDFANAAWNFVLVDPVSKVLRAWVAFKEDSSTGYPTRCLCFSIDTNTWWMEMYPHRISAGVAVPLHGGEYRCIYGAAGGTYLLGEGHVDAARGAVTKVTLTHKGSGYKTPPTVTAAGGVGAQFRAVLDGAGQVTGVLIVNPGSGYTDGALTFSAQDDLSGPAAAAIYTATPTNGDTATFPVYRYKTGNLAFPTDATPAKGGASPTRDISLTYAPQLAKCDITARLYYNNSRHARTNVAPRNRGVGFAASVGDGASRLNMAAQMTRTGEDSGVAKAVFANRSVDDFQSSDRHVAVELHGARRNADPVVIYALDVYGTLSGGG